MTRFALSALAALSILATAPLAAQVQIVGNARGCFGLGCSPSENAAAVLSGVPISYTSSAVDFSGTESGGALAINSAAGTGTFGRLTLGASKSILTAFSSAFTLSLGFLNPVAPNSVFNALLVGMLIFHDDGGALAIFYPSVVTSPYTDPATHISGTIAVMPFNMAIEGAGHADLVGQIALTKNLPAPTTTVTPEPLTLVMVGSGLAGLAAARRRKKTSPAPAA